MVKYLQAVAEAQKKVDKRRRLEVSLALLAIAGALYGLYRIVVLLMGVMNG